MLSPGVGVATGILKQPAVAVEQDRRGHQPVDEVTIVADQQDGSIVVGDDLLQQIQRFEVEVVGRLVQHQQVAGVCQVLWPASGGSARRPTSDSTGARAARSLNRKSRM